MGEGIITRRGGGDSLPPIGGTLASYTWAEIAKICEKGRPDWYFEVGDEKNITLSTSEVITLQIYGMYHDDLKAGGRAGITFGMKHSLAATRRMNPTDTNIGGWTNSEMRSWLSGTLLGQLPSDLQAVIKEVNKLTSAGNLSDAINTTADKVFLFSEIECFGSITHSKAGEGRQYPIFTDNSSRIKKLSNGSGDLCLWWERSPCADYATFFCDVSASGSVQAHSATTEWGVTFGFCV